MMHLLRQARVLDPASHLDEVLDILVVDGRVEKMGPSLAATDARVTDLRGKVVAPGFIDMHVHLREPGYEHKETIETGCRAAAAGGFTAVCCMPNTNPAIDDESVVRYVHEKGRQVVGGIVDVYPIAAVTKGRAGKELAPMAELASAGAVGFSDDGAPVENAGMMRRAFEYASMYGLPIIQHAEERSLAEGGSMNEGHVSTILGIPGIPSIAEELMVARDIALLRFVQGARYHVAHVSTALALRCIRGGKAEGLPISCEVTPHHFTLTDASVRTFDTNTKMNPPLRTQEDVQAMKEGLRDGTIDAIASDHAPHTIDEKEVEYTAAPFGIVGLETTVGLALTNLVHAGYLTLPQLVEKLSVNPRKIVGLPPVSIREGETVNLTILDPELSWKVDARRFKSQSRNSPFDGMVLRGKAVGIIHGKELWMDSST
ncbi:MAG TPA: dihydroorotase [Bacteroidota bacterium]|nr:dihydroorotase [Bacteroidota bacterium]